VSEDMSLSVRERTEGFLVVLESNFLSKGFSSV
jgi:hypothetical protein